MIHILRKLPGIDPEDVSIFDLGLSSIVIQRANFIAVHDDKMSQYYIYKCRISPQNRWVTGSEFLSLIHLHLEGYATYPKKTKEFV